MTPLDRPPSGAAAPLERLADVVGRMTAGPWTQCSGTDVRVFYERPSQHSHRMANASTTENAAGIATLRNLAPLLIAVARAARATKIRCRCTDYKGCEECVLINARDALDSAILATLGSVTKELGG